MFLLTHYSLDDARNHLFNKKENAVKWITSMGGYRKVADSTDGTIEGWSDASTGDHITIETVKVED